MKRMNLWCPCFEQNPMTKTKDHWTKRRELNESAFFIVLTNKDLFQLIISFQNGTKWKNYNNGDHAAAFGYLSLIKSKLQFGELLAFSSGAMDIAAANGHLETVIWLHENRSEGCT